MTLMQKPDYMNERIVERNRLPPRAYFLPAQSLLLSGRWRFHYAQSPLDAEPDSKKPEDWCLINVPGHWELQGHGHPHYTNFNYPFPVDPPNVPSKNPTGYYETTFSVPDDWTIQGGFKYRLRFEGVDSAFHLFVNGLEIGYNQGSRNASEFDITHVIRHGEGETNGLRVKVYKWSDGSYIEDQDMWWLSGIFRDVHLLAFPKKAHIEDFFVKTSFGKEGNGLLEVDVTPDLEFAVELRIKVRDLQGNIVAKPRIYECGPNNDTVTYLLSVPKPRKWTAETPNLYQLVLTISVNDTVFQEIEQRFGFRTVEIYEGLLRVNDVPILLRGVNRHEHHPRFGRAVPLDFMRQDLKQMKQHNINAVRCSHYPNHPHLVSMADEIGLYVLDEADLECHGMSVDWARVPSNLPSWRTAYLDRMQQLVHRDKNHPSVIMWSLGNEAYYGQNHAAMYRWSKTYDRTRPVHYEQDHEFRSSDVCSFMYLSVDDLINEATKDGDHYAKPVILQEYLHSMGNGPGGAGEYMNAFRNYRRLQGGFVWEWANHGILKEVGDGSRRTFYAYGGDFGDEPNDYNFVMDGLCDSEHQPGPGLLELKSAYQPVLVRLEGEGDFVHVYAENTYDFRDLDDLEATTSVVSSSPNGNESILFSERCALQNIKPSKSAIILSFSPKVYQKDNLDARLYLKISVRTTFDSAWAQAGHEIAHRDIWLRHDCFPQSSLLQPLRNADIKSTATSLRLQTSTCAIDFDLVRASLDRWKFQGQDLVKFGGSPRLTFWRAPTDNDRGGGGPLGDWLNHRLQMMTEEIRLVKHRVIQESHVLEITVQSYIAPPVLAWGFKTTTRYILHGNGKIIIFVNAHPVGPAPDTLPRVGFEMGLPKEQRCCEWSGLGPDQTYRDMKSAGKLGIWKKDIDHMNHMYEMPQETGNRTETRWVKVTDERGVGFKAVLQPGDGYGVDGVTSPEMPDLSGKSDDIEKSPSTSSLEGWQHVERQLPSQENLGADHGFDFALSRYTANQLDRAQHPFELAESEETIFRIDAGHHGLGTASCGPGALEKYKLKTGDFRFTISLEPIHG